MKVISWWLICNRFRHLRASVAIHINLGSKKGGHASEVWKLHLEIRFLRNYSNCSIRILSMNWTTNWNVQCQDVAVKVLTVQDFHDDQLREFLREVCACSETWMIYFTTSLPSSLALVAIMSLAWAVTTNAFYLSYPRTLCNFSGKKVFQATCRL